MLVAQLAVVLVVIQPEKKAAAATHESPAGEPAYSES